MTRVVVCLALSVVFGASLGFLATRSIAAAQSPGALDGPARAAPPRPVPPPVRMVIASLDLLKYGESVIAGRACRTQPGRRMTAPLFATDVEFLEPQGRS
jgi:hypothetical protein